MSRLLLLLALTACSSPQQAAAPRIPERCLTPGDIGASRYGAYSMLEPSRTCSDGRLLTDAGTLGFGFVGRPLVGSTQSSPDRSAGSACRNGLPVDTR